MSLRGQIQRVSLACAVALLACSGGMSHAPDSGAPDGGPASSSTDAGPNDSGFPDSGEPDAGLPDAGTSDAGSSDAGDAGDGGDARDGGPCTVPNAPCILPDGGAVDAFCCAGKCVDVSADSANCNGCGLACTADQYCGRGACTPFATCATAQAWLTSYTCELPAGGSGYCCNGACQAGDLSSDPMNCGDCANACPSGVACVGGRCVRDGGAPFYCGASGATCPLGTTCIFDSCLLTACTATTPLDACAANFGTYLDLGGCCGLTCSTMNDNQNCGACGNACDAGSTWEYNACVLEHCALSDEGKPCTAGPGTAPGDTHRGTCCSSTCADLGQSPEHCGACGNACPSGICGNEEGGGCFVDDAGPPTGCGSGCAMGQVCIGSRCIPSVCTPGLGGICSLNGGLGSCCYPSVCADLANDPRNCGGCYINCPAGQTCSNGSCSGDTPPCGVGSAGLTCEPGDGGSGVCCPGAGCIDLRTDTSNCGSCDHACASDAGCSSGQCI